MKNRKKRPFARKLLVFFLVFAILSILSVLVVAAGAVYYVETTTEAHLDISQYEFGEAVSGSTLYYYEFTDRANRIGEPQILTTVSAGGSDGGYVNYDLLPQDLIDAFVAIEDKRFWTHHGVDWGRTASAAANYVLHFQSTFAKATELRMMTRLRSFLAIRLRRF